MKRFFVDYNAPFTLTFFFSSLALMVAAAMTKGNALELFMARPDLAPFDLRFYAGLVLHPLGHGNWMHFFSNFTILLLLAPMLEEKYGSQALALFSLITAVLTGLLHALFFDSYLLGASGIVFMAILLSSFARFRSGTIPLTFVLVVFIYLGGEIWSAVEGKDNISQFAHIFGGFCGAAFGFFVRPKPGA